MGFVFRAAGLRFGLSDFYGGRYKGSLPRLTGVQEGAEERGNSIGNVEGGKDSIQKVSGRAILPWLSRKSRLNLGFGRIC